MQESAPKLRGTARSALLLLSFLAAPVAAAPAPLGMRVIPESTIVLGSTLEEIMEVTEICSKKRHTHPCAPEDFSGEMESGQATKIASFFMDAHEVSVRDYDGCVEGGRCSPLKYELGPPELFRPDHPAVFVSFDDARAYCSFVGARLPTESEFEAAARGSTRRPFPWGRWFHASRANAGSYDSAQTTDRDGHSLTAPVDAYPDGRTPQGVYQLAGNVAEWTSSPFVAHGSRETATARVVKGGSFAAPFTQLRGAARREAAPWQRYSDVGFRCAKTR